MASFAQLDEENKVVNIIKISNEEILDDNGNESEELGIKRCKEITGENTNWIQTWYSDPPLKRYRSAGIGMFYNKELDVFVFTKPFDSWVLNTETYGWEPPTPKPDRVLDGPVFYQWNEETLSWVEVDIPKPDEENEWEWDTEKGFWKPIISEPVGITTS